jgi:hypothetical protein
MNDIPKVSLEDTLYLIQLARETALSKGKDQQADRLAPVAEEMRKVVTVSRQTSGSVSTSANTSGILGQPDFQKMLEASKVKSTTGLEALSTNSVMDRSRVVGAMASSGMSELDIARQLGMTRDEVKLVLNVQNRSNRSTEVHK